MKAARRVDHDVWTTVQWPAARALEWARSLTKDPNVDAIVAIGSAARGHARSGSDVDLIVLCKSARNRIAAPLEVDARWIGRSKLAESVRDGDDVCAWGVAYGTSLYDPKEIWLRFVRQWRDDLPLPTPQMCAKRADRARRYAADLVGIGDDDAASEQALTMLTHEARLALCVRGVFPASRGELAEQLRGIRALELASLLARAIEGSLDPRDALDFSSRP